MTDREKLVELLDYIGNSQEFSCYDFYDMSDAAESIADFLISKGVTVREWISVKDELPKSEVLAANFAPGTHGYKDGCSMTPGVRFTLMSPTGSPCPNRRRRKYCESISL